MVDLVGGVVGAGVVVAVAGGGRARPIPPPPPLMGFPVDAVVVVVEEVGVVDIGGAIVNVNCSSNEKTGGTCPSVI